MLEFILILLYVVSPLDLVPGPIDDVVIIIAGIIYGIVNIASSFSIGDSAQNTSETNYKESNESENEYEEYENYENYEENNEEDYEEDDKNDSEDEDNYY